MNEQTSVMEERMKTTTRLSASVFLVVIVVAGLGMSQYACHAESTPQRDFHAVVHVRYYRNSPQDIVTLKIPEGYIDRRVEGPRIEGVQNELYFEALGPALSPRAEENQALFSFPASLRQVVRFKIRSLYRLQPHQIDVRTQEVWKFRSEDRSAPCRWSEKTDVMYGLHHQMIDTVSCPNEPLYGIGRRDLYQARARNNEITTVIRCTPMDWKEADPSAINGRTLSPGIYCEHSFTSKVLNSWVHLKYHRDFLPHWREIERSAETILTAFVGPN
jgi:hypothetical protein